MVVKLKIYGKGLDDGGNLTRLGKGATTKGNRQKKKFKAIVPLNHLPIC